MSVNELSLSEEEKIYLGAMIDGEGGINIGFGKNIERNKYEIYPRYQMTMNYGRDQDYTRDLFIRFFRSLPVAWTDNDTGGGISWHMSVNKLKDVKLLLREIRPYVEDKRGQIDDILSFRWTAVNTDPHRFLEALKFRDRYRRKHLMRKDVDHDYETVVEDLGLHDRQEFDEQASQFSYFEHDVDYDHIQMLHAPLLTYDEFGMLESDKNTQTLPAREVSW